MKILLSCERLLRICVSIESFRDYLCAVDDVSRKEEAEEALDSGGVDLNCREFFVVRDVSKESIDEVTSGVPRSCCISTVAIASEVIHKGRNDLVPVCSNKVV